MTDAFINEMCKGLEMSRTETAFFRDLWSCLQPSRFLKVVKGGKFSTGSKYRHFWISPDLSKIQCAHSFTNGKGDQLKSIAISAIKEIKLGKTTDNLRRGGNSHLKDSVCFSWFFSAKNHPFHCYDLACRDDLERLRWTNCLKTLMDNKIKSEMMDMIIVKIRQNFVFECTSVSGMAVGGKASNDLYAFGWSQWGQCGLGPEVERNVSKPATVPLEQGIKGVAAGWSHTCFLQEGGQVLQCGSVVATHLTYDTFTVMNVSGISDRVQIASVACGANHSIACSTDGVIFTWGANLHGQLGHGNMEDVASPKLVNIEGLVVEVAASRNACIVIAENGTKKGTQGTNIYTWGCGAHGQLGHNNTKDCLVPTSVTDLLGIDIRMIAAGDDHMMACTEYETYAWGWNGCGQLGVGHKDDQSRPTVVDSLRGSTVRSLSAGAGHSVAVADGIAANGLVYVWGSNTEGQLGQLGKRPSAVPVLYPTPLLDCNLPPISMVSCGSMHTMLLTEDGDVMGAGCNLNGQLGLGNFIGVNAFKTLPFFQDKKALSVACGGSHTTVLSSRR